MLEIGVNQNILELLRMGVPDLQEAFQNNLLGLDQRINSNPVILFAGELGNRKGLLETLQSLADERLQDLNLIVAGSGDFQKWKQIATRLNVDSRVAFIGLRSYREIHQYFRNKHGSFQQQCVNDVQRSQRIICKLCLWRFDQRALYRRKLDELAKCRSLRRCHIWSDQCK
jgi:glycosyltransferase involved in cell wall biosynthesis